MGSWCRSTIPPQQMLTGDPNGAVHTSSGTSPIGATGTAAGARVDDPRGRGPSAQFVERSVVERYRRCRVPSSHLGRAEPGREPPHRSCAGPQRPTAGRAAAANGSRALPPPACNQSGVPSRFNAHSRECGPRRGPRPRSNRPGTSREAREVRQRGVRDGHGGGVWVNIEPPIAPLPVDKNKPCRVSIK
jgi:hypothetical protein